MGWTDEKVSELKRLWQEGKSTGEIGKILGVSKNAVVGKAHRLDLEARPSPIKRDVNKKEAETTSSSVSSASPFVQSKPAPATVAAKPKEKEAEKSAKKAKEGLSLTELTMTTCRWPIGDPKDEDFHFCGKETALGKPYCEKHIAEAFVGINKR